MATPPPEPHPAAAFRPVRAARLATRLAVWLMAVAAGAAGPANAQRPAPAAVTGGPLWISDTPLDDGKRLLIVIDPASRHAAVYHVDPVSGGMVLKSTRDISWDLRLDEFNALEPKPATLRKMLEPAGRP
jgi:hypothetical protein